jgi:hypothetical protein
VSGIERRKYRRAVIITEVEIVAGGEKLLAPTRDISIGGLFLQSTTVPPADTQVRVQFHLEPGKPPVEALARIAYIVPGRGAGVEFTELSAENLSRIESFVASAAAAPLPTDQLPSI